MATYLSLPVRILLILYDTYKQSVIGWWWGRSSVTPLRSCPESSVLLFLPHNLSFLFISHEHRNRDVPISAEAAGPCHLHCGQCHLWEPFLSANGVALAFPRREIVELNDCTIPSVLILQLSPCSNLSRSGRAILPPVLCSTLSPRPPGHYLPFTDS